MPFPYTHVCTLLEQLDGIAKRPVLLDTKTKTNDAAVRWLNLHRKKLNEQSVDSQAVMAMLHSVHRTDRNYGLDAGRLEQLIVRALGLSKQLYDKLRLWRQGPTHGDLAACVQRVVQELPPNPTPRAAASQVSVEDIDFALVSIAARNPNSSPALRQLASKVENHDLIELLGKFYRELGGNEAKWLTRLILKDYGVLEFPTSLDMSSHNPFLPRCVQVNAEVPMGDGVPLLRDGSSFVYGTNPIQPTSGQLPSALVPTPAPNVASSALITANQIPTPSEAATERLRKKYGASHPPISQSATLSKTAKRIMGKPSQHLANQIITPPRTAPRSRPLAEPPQKAHQLSSQPRTREPLSSLATNIVSSQSFRADSQEQPPSLTTGSAILIAISINRQITTSQSSASGVSRKSIPKTQLSEPSACLTISGSGTCILTTTGCPLVNCLFLLSPCISDSPYILENLLAWHGSRIITSSRALADPSLPRHCPHTGRRYRKIALVEPNRTDQTVAFLKDVEALKLQKRVKNGRDKVKEKQWVEVYDWRLLECMAKIDRGKESAYNPWRRCWMGAI